MGVAGTIIMHGGAARSCARIDSDMACYAPDVWRPLPEGPVLPVYGVSLITVTGHFY